jgi:hypothetical protein
LVPIKAGFKAGSTEALNGVDVGVVPEELKLLKLNPVRGVFVAPVARGTEGEVGTAAEAAGAAPPAELTGTVPPKGTYVAGLVQVVSRVDFL